MNESDKNFIKSLQIEEFRGIKQTIKPIPFSNFNVLFGPNNSGKSTILEALSLLPFPNMSDLIQTCLKINMIRDFNNLGGTNKSLLYLYSGTSQIKYDTILGKIKLTLDLNDYNFSPISLIQEEARKSKISLEKAVLFIPNKSEFLRYMEIQMAEKKETIIKKGWDRKITEFLGNIVKDQFTKIVFGQPICLEKQIKDKTVPIPLSDLGSGIERIAKMIPLVEIINPQLLLVDNFGTGLYPVSIRRTLEWLMTNDCQVIISTHSTDVLRIVNELKPKGTQMIFLDKDKNDNLKNKVFSSEEISDFINHSTEFK